MDMIDLLPPGLYEAVITGVDENTANPELIEGEYLFAIEPRTLEHIRALGGNDAEDDMRFATAARVSEINRGLYEALLRPAIRASVTQQSAEFSRSDESAPAPIRVVLGSHPLMRPVAACAEAVRANRLQAKADNPFLAIEHAVSDDDHEHARYVGRHTRHDGRSRCS